MYFTSQDIRNRRERLREKWDALLQPGEAVLVLAGERLQKPGGLDQHYPFLPHPAYFWLTGRRRESEVLLYSKDTGWLEFQKDIPPAEAIWEGERQDLLVNDAGRSLAGLDAFLAGQRFTQVSMIKGMSGLELRRAINGADFLRRKAIPFIILTDFATAENVKEAYDLTVQGFYRKAATMPQLKEQLKLIVTYWMHCLHPNSGELF